MGKKQKKKTAPKRLTKHYSGTASEQFWDAVNNLEGEAQEGAYMLGCALQDLEDRTIIYINNALAKDVETRLTNLRERAKGKWDAQQRS